MQAKTFYILLLAITAIKITIAFFVPNINTWEDYVIAENIINSGDFYCMNDGAVNHSFQFPVYPILLSIAIAIYHTPVAGVLLNILLSAISCHIFLRNLQNLHHEAWLKIASKHLRYLALLPLLHPAFAYYELTNAHPFIHDFLMLNIACAALLKSTDSSTKKPLEIGLLFGLSILGRGTFIVFPMLALLLLLLRKNYKRAMLIAIGTALMLAPWLAHNYLSDGLVGLTSTSGKILWKGSLHHSDGGNYLHNGQNYYSALSADDLTILGQSSVKEQNDFFNQRYLTLLREEPLHVLRMFAIKLKNFWFFGDISGTEHPPALIALWTTYRVCNFIFIALLFGLLFKVRSSAFLILPLVLFSMLQCWFYFESRHRLILEPFLIVILVHLLVNSNKSFSAQ